MTSVVKKLYGNYKSMTLLMYGKSRMLQTLYPNVTTAHNNYITSAFKMKPADGLRNVNKPSTRPERCQNYVQLRIVTHIK